MLYNFSVAAAFCCGIGFGVFGTLLAVAHYRDPNDEAYGDDPTDWAKSSPPVAPQPVLVWKNNQARSARGDLYEIIRLSENVAIIRINGTEQPGWALSEDALRLSAEAHAERRLRQMGSYPAIPA